MPEDLAEHEELHANLASSLAKIAAGLIILVPAMICVLAFLALVLYGAWLYFRNIGAPIAIVCFDVALIFAAPRSWRVAVFGLFGDSAKVTWLDKLATRIEGWLKKKGK